MTRRSKAIKKDGDGIGYVAEMSQALAARYGIKQGDFTKRGVDTAISSSRPTSRMSSVAASSGFCRYRESRYDELTGNDRVIGKSSILKAAVQIRRIGSICELKRIRS